MLLVSMSHKKEPEMLLEYLVSVTPEQSIDTYTAGYS